MEFNTYWSKYEQHLYNFIKEKVRAEEDAKDILQEVALKFDWTIKNGKVEKPKAWLFQVARNTIADYYRREAKNKTITQELPEVSDQPVYNPCVCDLTEFVIQNYLPQKYGQALILGDIEKIPQKEIAERLNLTLTATKSRIQRGRKLLRELIEQCVEITYKPDGTIPGFQLKSNCTLPAELIQEIERLKISI